MCTSSLEVKQGTITKLIYEMHVYIQAQIVMVSYLLREQTVRSIPVAPCQPEPEPLGLPTPHTIPTVNEMQYSLT